MKTNQEKYRQNKEKPVLAFKDDSTFCVEQNIKSTMETFENNIPRSFENELFRNSYKNKLLTFLIYNFKGLLNFIILGK